MVRDAAENDKSFSVAGVLRKPGISTSGYYNWRKRCESHSKARKKRIMDEIKTIHKASHMVYGAPKITHVLNEKGIAVSQRTVSVYMREMGIKARYIQPRTRTTINSDFSSTLHNLLKREFNPEHPNAVWCTDITYIWTVDEGFVYLTSVMDLYSRKIVAWTLSRTMEAEEVLQSVRKAKERRDLDDVLVLHSDRGIQFVCGKYQELTAGMKTSYSRKGNPWDNACIESFHALIKRECLKHHRIQNYEEAYQLVFEYIETFYNTVRIHSHCDYQSPNDYEKQYELQKKSLFN